MVLYQGTLNDGRLDIDLCVEIAERLAGQASVVFVGPSSLSPLSDDRLRRAGAILLGARPSAAMPGYMQHADALIVPHEVNPFTESLDPIKAREFVAVGRPTVSHPRRRFSGPRAPGADRGPRAASSANCSARPGRAAPAGSRTVDLGSGDMDATGPSPSWPCSTPPPLGRTEQDEPAPAPAATR